MIRHNLTDLTDGDDADFQRVIITIVSPDGGRANFRMGIDQQMIHCMRAYSERQRVHISMFKFTLRDLVVYDNHTPTDLGIVRSAIIRATLYPQ